MATRETELPGVGTKSSFDLASGEELVVVEHHAGHFEIARLDKEGEPLSRLELRQREAAELGRILSRGAVAEEDSRKRVLFQQLSIEWLELGAGSALVGETLIGSEIRQSTGVNVIAILREDGPIANPSPETDLRAGDTLVVMGAREQVDRFLEAYSAIQPDA